jgi:hypothetical protein
MLNIPLSIANVLIDMHVKVLAPRFPLPAAAFGFHLQSFYKFLPFPLFKYLKFQSNHHTIYNAPHRTATMSNPTTAPFTNASWANQVLNYHIEYQDLERRNLSPHVLLQQAATTLNFIRTARPPGITYSEVVQNMVDTAILAVDEHTTTIDTECKAYVVYIHGSVE